MNKISDIIKKSGVPSWAFWVILIFIIVWYRDGFEVALVGTGILTSGYLLGINLLTIIIQLKEKLKIQFDKKHLISFLVIFIITVVYIGKEGILLFVPVIALPIVLSALFSK